MPPGDDQQKPKSFWRTIGMRFWVLVVVLLVLNYLSVAIFAPGREQSVTIPYQPDFVGQVEADNVAKISTTGESVSGEFKKEFKPSTDKDAEAAKNFETEIPTFADNDALSALLQEHDVTIEAEPVNQGRGFLLNLILGFGPVILLVVLFVWLSRRAAGGQMNALGSFGRSRARRIEGAQTKVTFKDVAGIDESKQELTEVVDFLKNPDRYRKLGGRIPRGVLLSGQPGTGKTLLAKAIAGEANVPFFSISGSDFVEMFVGVGASRVRDLFEQGKKHAPCIIFMDEIDAVGRHRGAGLGGGHDEREQTLNQLLVEMDGFETNEGVILIAATNRPDVLDPALLRPGRFDRQVVVARPDVKGREEILRVHARRIPLAPSVDLRVLSRGTPGFSGADLANLVNEAALLAARQDKKIVEMMDFENAKDKVLMGVERRSMIISDTEKRTIAYHEAGHALVADLLPGADPLHKVTIIPRGRALGLTQQLPTDDKYNYSREYLINRITILMGGRAAEELVLQQQTTGAGDDLEKATEMARKMVCEWGMSDRMGPLTFGKGEEHIFLGREMSRPKDYSEDTAIVIDGEIKRIVTECASRARQLIEDNMEKLHALARALLERESLDGEEIARIIRARPFQEAPSPA
jgi:cell division protease FtsH